MTKEEIEQEELEKAVDQLFEVKNVMNDEDKDYVLDEIGEVTAFLNLIACATDDFSYEDVSVLSVKYFIFQFLDIFINVYIFLYFYIYLKTCLLLFIL